MATRISRGSRYIYNIIYLYVTLWTRSFIFLFLNSFPFRYETIIYNCKIHVEYKKYSLDVSYLTIWNTALRLYTSLRNVYARARVCVFLRACVPFFACVGASVCLLCLSVSVFPCPCSRMSLRFRVTVWQACKRVGVQFSCNVFRVRMRSVSFTYDLSARAYDEKVFSFFPFLRLRGEGNLGSRFRRIPNRSASNTLGNASVDFPPFIIRRRPGKKHPRARASLSRGKKCRTFGVRLGPYKGVCSLS